MRKTFRRLAAFEGLPGAKREEAANTADQIECSLSEAIETRKTIAVSISQFETLSGQIAQHSVPAAFVYLMAMLDSFIVDVLAYHYRLHPRKMQRKVQSDKFTRKELADQKKVPYDAIFSCESLDKLIDWMIDREVGQITREDVGMQIDALTDLGIDLPTVDKERLREIAAVRNIYVHNNGRINAEYLTKTNRYWKARGGNSFKLGELYPLDTAYFRSAADMALLLVESVSNALK